MKIRNGFVSNSSSSSFVLSLKHVSEAQLQLLFKHIDVAKIYGEEYDTSPCDEWKLEVNEHSIEGRTRMNNFDMYEFIRYIGIDPELAEWSE